jgi:hypothetical protein
VTRRTRRRLTDGACTASLVASDASIEAALEPVKLLEGVGKGGGDVSSRSTVQPPCLDQPGTSGGIAEGALKVPCGWAWLCLFLRQRHRQQARALGVGGRS